MAGFRKAKCEQAAIKMSMYGQPGSGKTLSALLFAEGLSRLTGKRTAFVDTERGTDFYTLRVPEREVHPEPFDFDALYTRSVTEVVRELKALDPATHGQIVLDSITHIWEATINAYTGPKTKAGTIPMWAWGPIKRPYKELMKLLIDGPHHVFILGRQGNVFEEDEETGESKAAGTKMKAEGETAYEPHICLHMVPQRTSRQGKRTVVHKEHVIAAHAEKDRSGILSGRLIEWPSYDNVIAPLMGLLGTEQGATPSDEEAALQDAEAIAQAEREKGAVSRELAEDYKARFRLAKAAADLAAIGKELTPATKKKLTSRDLADVRSAYQARDRELSGKPAEAPAPEPAEEAA